MESSEQPRRGNGVVRFDSAVWVKPGLHIQNYTPEERCACWYQRAEYKTIQQAAAPVDNNNKEWKKKNYGPAALFTVVLLGMAFLAEYQSGAAAVGVLRDGSTTTKTGMATAGTETGSRTPKSAKAGASSVYYGYAAKRAKAGPGSGYSGYYRTSKSDKKKSSKKDDKKQKKSRKAALRIVETIDPVDPNGSGDITLSLGFNAARLHGHCKSHSDARLANAQCQVILSKVSAKCDCDSKFSCIINTANEYYGSLIDGVFVKWSNCIQYHWNRKD